MGKKTNPALIGAFVVGALALVVMGVALFGSGRLFRHTQKMVLFFEGNVNGLRVGAPVKFKGVEVGAVDDIRLNLGSHQRLPEDVRIPVIIELDQDRITEKGARITMDEAMIQQAVERGFRAQLNTESFVTGVLYVELDYFPGTAVHLVRDPDVPYFKNTPTLPTTLEQVQTKASEIISKLSASDIEGLVRSITETVHGINKLVNSPKLHAAVDSLDDTLQNLNTAVKDFDKVAHDVRKSEVAKSLRATSDQAAAALDNIRSLLEPGSPLTYQLGHTLEDVAQAARSVRALADYLERNPSALVRGRPAPEERR